MCIYGNYSFDKPLFCLGKETAGLKSRGVAIRWLRSPVFSDSQSAILAVQPYSRLCFFFFILCFFLKKKNNNTHTQLYIRKADTYRHPGRSLPLTGCMYSSTESSAHWHPSWCSTSLFLHWQGGSLSVYIRWELLGTIFGRLSLWYSPLLSAFCTLTAELGRSWAQAAEMCWGTEMPLAATNCLTCNVRDRFQLFSFSVLKVGLTLPQHLRIVFGNGRIM